MCPALPALPARVINGIVKSALGDKNNGMGGISAFTFICLCFVASG